MSKISVSGVDRLEGRVRVQGSKNAVLPILAAALINEKECIIHNCPDLSDVKAVCNILKCIGCTVEFKNGTVTVNSAGANNYVVPCELMKCIRSSFVFMGALLARFKKAVMCLPGGCPIGARPVDMHIKALNCLGCMVEQTDENIFSAQCISAIGGVVNLDFPSVGATENIMMYACKGMGITQIHNAALEPEICDLANFLNSMGANIYGAGTKNITIYGVEKLESAEYTVMADRIEQSTLMSAVCMTGGKLELFDCCNSCLNIYTEFLKKLGCNITIYNEKKLKLVSDGKMLKDGACVKICTEPYPGFPTDCQSLAMTLVAASYGRSIIEENIFENRMNHAFELNKMGADIKLKGNCAFVNGVGKLCGCEVCARDLRSGAALVAAGLAATGRTIVNNAEYIYRGYECLENKLSYLGADAERIE